MLIDFTDTVAEKTHKRVIACTFEFGLRIEHVVLLWSRDDDLRSDFCHIIRAWNVDAYDDTNVNVI